MTQKIFVNSDLHAVIQCPECGQSYKKDVSKFIGHKTQVRLKYTCKCKHSFPVMLERRHFIRKQVNLKGFVIDKSNKIPLTVVDISQQGLQFKIAYNVSYKVGDIFHIEFTLDDQTHSKISREVEVKRFPPPVKFGCEFTTQDHYDNLGKYFLYQF